VFYKVLETQHNFRAKKQLDGFNNENDVTLGFQEGVF